MYAYCAKCVCGGSVRHKRYSMMVHSARHVSANVTATRAPARSTVADAMGEPSEPTGAILLSEQDELPPTGFFEEVDHPVVGRIPVVRPPFRFATVERWHRRPAPTMGEHNHEVLSELGVPEAEIAQLETDEVIGYKPKGL